MNYERENGYGQTIMADLNSWDKLDKELKSACDDKTYGHREISKLRLYEYERIWNAYRGRVMSRDEKAWLTVVLVKKRNLEKELYPSILSRMLRQMIKNLLPLLDGKQELIQAGYYDNHIISKYTNDDLSAGKSLQQEDQNQQRNQYVGPNLGPKRENKPGNSLHI